MSNLAHAHHPVRSLESQLEDFCREAAANSGRINLDLRFRLTIEGALPVENRSAVLAAIPVMVSNAIEHGFYGYSCGEIDIQLVGGHADTLLAVADNGWGVEGGLDVLSVGGGLRFLRSLGEVSLTSEQIAPGRRRTTVSLLLPRLRPVGNG